MNLSLVNALNQTTYSNDAKNFITELFQKNFQNDEILLYRDNEEGSHSIILIKKKIQMGSNVLTTFFYLYNNLMKKGPTIVFEGLPKLKLKDKYNTLIAKTTLKFKFETLLKWNNQISFFEQILKIIEDKFKNDFPFEKSSSNIYYNPICTLEDATLKTIKLNDMDTILINPNLNNGKKDDPECNTEEHIKLRELILERKNETLKNQINVFNEQNNNLNKQILIVQDESKRFANETNELQKYKNILNNLLDDYEKTGNKINNELNNTNYNEKDVKSIIEELIDIPVKSKLQLELQAKIDTIEDFLLSLKSAFPKNLIPFQEVIKIYRINSRDIFYLHSKIKSLNN
jgi:hypothetical protein